MQASELPQRAAALAQAAPEQWRAFVSALTAFNEHHRENLIRSALSDLPVNQGRAQMTGIILDIMAKALNAGPTKKDK